MFIWMKLGIVELWNLRLTNSWETVNHQVLGLVFIARRKVSKEKDHLITLSSTSGPLVGNP